MEYYYKLLKKMKLFTYWYENISNVYYFKNLKM